MHGAEGRWKLIFIKGTNIRIKRPNGIVVVQTVAQEQPNV